MVTTDLIVTDLCVLCQKDTEVPTDTPVEKRMHYIVGCGQLCKTCYADIHMSGNFFLLNVNE